jgi:hypothetical protein
VIFGGRLGGWREIARRAAARSVRVPGVSRIVSVNLAVPEPNPAKGVGVTGINKRPVDHLVTVRAPGPKTTGLHSGLVGDQIFDIEHHGGDDQAVYAYAREEPGARAAASRVAELGPDGFRVGVVEFVHNGQSLPPCCPSSGPVGPVWTPKGMRCGRHGACLRVLPGRRGRRGCR